VSGGAHQLAGNGRKHFDVAVIGGGVAGLSAALQLEQQRPNTRILVAEKLEHPVPPTAHKVGEALAEASSHYFGQVLGLEDYLLKEHLRKMGLRWYMPNGPNKDIARRIEVGLIRQTPLKTYMIDRGAIENHMVNLASDRGIEFRDSTMVSDVELGSDRHSLTLRRNGSTEAITARWVVDASGRQALLRNKRQLGIDLPIDVGAAWFRIPYQLVVDEWSDDEAWRAQVPAGTRWRSTVSFIGKGYWTWVINLGSGCCSVGVVANPGSVPWNRIRRYDALRSFLMEVEPQLASHLPEDESGLLDFMKRKTFSRASIRAFSRGRWALAGEAAVFVDPLYSTGHDTTAIGNTLMTDLIRRELDGENGTAFSKRVRSHNRSLLGLVRFAIEAFPEAMEIYGDAQASSCKIAWDNLCYFSVMLPMFTKGAFVEPELTRKLMPFSRLQWELNSSMQKHFHEWGRSDADRRDAGIPYPRDQVADHYYAKAQTPMSHDELYDYVEESVEQLKQLAGEMTSRMSEAAGESPPPLPVDPPKASDEVLAWAEYGRRVGPPAARDPQPADGWAIR
jgi:flavin-dependent dehydrogenase